MGNNRVLSSTKIILILWLALILIAKAPGKFEGNYFPVSDDFSYTLQASKYEENASDIYLNFNKIRPECAFRKIDFYLYGQDDAGNDQFVLMRSAYKGLEETRFKGKHDGVGPWVLMNTPDKLDNMTIMVYHRCHVGFQTISMYRIRDGVYVPSEIPSISMN